MLSTHSFFKNSVISDFVCNMAPQKVNNLFEIFSDFNKSWNFSINLQLDEVFN